MAATAAAGHLLHLVLCPLLLLVVVGAVLGDGDVDLPEQQLVEPRPNGRPLCRSLGGRCYHAGQSALQHAAGNNCLPKGGPWCKGPKLSCCYNPDSTSDCIAGTTVYPHGVSFPFPSPCIELECNDGTWEIKRLYPRCGECKVFGDPHIQTFDKSSVLDDNVMTTTQVYWLNRCGKYIVAQPGLSDRAEFGVNSNFKYCDYLSDHGQCIDSMTYYEYADTSITPRDNITMLPPPAWIAASCDFTSRDPRCDIEVIWNGKPLTVVGAYETLTGIWIIKDTYRYLNYENEYYDFNCMTIIGNKGFSVTLCQTNQNYPYLFINAESTLKDKLNGLCNTYTETTASEMVKRDGTDVPSDTCLPYGDYEVCEEFSDSWKFQDN